MGVAMEGRRGMGPCWSETARRSTATDTGGRAVYPPQKAGSNRPEADTVVHKCGWRGCAGGEEAWKEPFRRDGRLEAHGSQEGPGEDFREVQQAGGGRQRATRPCRGNTVATCGKGVVELSLIHI